MRYFNFILFIILVVVALWVFYDSQKRGYTVWRGLLWATGVFWVMIFFLPLYLVARKRKERLLVQAGQTREPFPRTSCFYCGKSYVAAPPICPHCGQNLKILDHLQIS